MGELENAYRLLKNTKRKLKRLQHSSKAVPSSVESAKIHDLEAQLKLKDDAVKNVENEKMLLEEKI